MGFIGLIEKTLRKWQLWTIVLPLFIIITSSIITGKVMDFREIFLGIILFPGYAVEAMVGKLSMWPRLDSLLFLFVPYGLYIFFIIKAKKLDKKILFISAAIILMLVIFGIKGCTPALEYGFM